MKAWQITNERGVDGLTLAELPDPEPGPGQVLVQIQANSVNFRDLSMVTDPVGRGLTLPLVPNSDGAGQVIAVGDGVAEFAVGDAVAGCFFQRWPAGECSATAMASALGGALDGVLCEQRVFEVDGLVKVPTHLTAAQAACLPCAALTAWRALVPVGQICAGDTVLLLGTGGVSVFALQFAHQMGARVIITSSSDDKLARAREMGAWQTINYRTYPDWEQQVLAMTDGRGVDLTVETGGAGTLERSVQATRVAGRIGLIGVLASGQLDPTLIMRKSIALQGIYVGSTEMFQQMNRAIDAGTLEPVIDQRVAFDAAPDAYRAMQAAKHFGKIVIEY